MPIDSVLGSDLIPAAVALKLRQAAERVRSASPDAPKDGWRVIEALLDKFLSP